MLFTSAFADPAAPQPLVDLGAFVAKLQQDLHEATTSRDELAAKVVELESQATADQREIGELRVANARNAGAVLDSQLRAEALQRQLGEARRAAAGAAEHEGRDAQALAGSLDAATAQVQALAAQLEASLALAGRERLRGDRAERDLQQAQEQCQRAQELAAAEAERKAHYKGKCRALGQHYREIRNSCQRYKLEFQRVVQHLRGVLLPPLPPGQQRQETRPHAPLQQQQLPAAMVQGEEMAGGAEGGRRLSSSSLEAAATSDDDLEGAVAAAERRASWASAGTAATGGRGVAAQPAALPAALPAPAAQQQQQQQQEEEEAAEEDAARQGDLLTEAAGWASDGEDLTQPDLHPPRNHSRASGSAGRQQQEQRGEQANTSVGGPAPRGDSNPPHLSLSSVTKARPGSQALPAVVTPPAAAAVSAGGEEGVGAGSRKRPSPEHEAAQPAEHALPVNIAPSPKRQQCGFYQQQAQQQQAQQCQAQQCQQQEQQCYEPPPPQQQQQQQQQQPQLQQQQLLQQQVAGWPPAGYPAPAAQPAAAALTRPAAPVAAGGGWKAAVRSREDDFDNFDARHRLHLPPPLNGALLITGAGRPPQAQPLLRPLHPGGGSWASHGAAGGSGVPPLHRAPTPDGNRENQGQGGKAQLPGPGGGVGGSGGGGGRRETKYQAVVRNRSEREKLQGVECQSCKGFYAAIHSWGTATVALPSCGHIRAAATDAAGGAGPGGGGVHPQHMQQDASRHRYIFEPPPSPQGFWDMDFTPAPQHSQLM